MSTQNIAKNRIVYECIICNYTSYNKYDYEKHIKTIKHINNVLATKTSTLATNLSQKSQDHNFMCSNCNKHYKDKSGLWRHSKKCNKENLKEHTNEVLQPVCTPDIDANKNTHNVQNIATDKDLIMLLIKENSELKTMMIEQQSMVMKVLENGTHNTTTTHTNSHNKAFNLNFFLNETCKNAMNISDFVSSIKVTLEDLEYTGRQGYIQGISNIIFKN
jgi:hypothetical protein